MLMLPLLIIFADIIAILGGMYLAKSAAGISYDSFIHSARVYSEFNDFLKGMFKGLFFAVIIVLIGCYQGLATFAAARPAWARRRRARSSPRSS